MAVELHGARQPGRVGRSGLAMGLGKAVGGLGSGGLFGGAGGEGKTRTKMASKGDGFHGLGSFAVCFIACAQAGIDSSLREQDFKPGTRRCVQCIFLGVVILAAFFRPQHCSTGDDDRSNFRCAGWVIRVARGGECNGILHHLSVKVRHNCSISCRSC